MSTEEKIIHDIPRSYMKWWYWLMLISGWLMIIGGVVWANIS